MPYSASLLTNPEANMRMGTAYLPRHTRNSATCIWRWPATTPAKRAVRQWIAERPGLPRDEFIDDIPYPETQNYVKTHSGNGGGLQATLRESGHWG